MHEFAKMKSQNRIWILEFEPRPDGVEIIGVYRDDSDHPCKGDQCWEFQVDDAKVVTSVVIGPYHHIGVPDKPLMRRHPVLNPHPMSLYIMDGPKENPGTAPRSSAPSVGPADKPARKTSREPLSMELDENNIPARYADLPKEEALRRWKNCIASKKSRNKKEAS